ncbi:hypothetical protein N0B31_17755 [Salinirubellus salinus]|uniref:EVE domain-containing protein n=1 Tax=Salinirubellus salinus TaxID=1364945 RepID=A0A9E7UA78_9EURY|nr:hypothetical protein [Salinirubellus salinus]UWM53958.1 hypothetical protein N0B31_17755 [Salinirubellus salinus]
MTNVYLIPVGDNWIDHFERTVEQPLTIGDSDAPAELDDFQEVRIWATTESSKKESAYEAMRSGDLLMFYRQGEFFAAGRVGRTFRSSAAGDWIWDNSESSFIFTVTDYEPISISRDQLWDVLGYSSGYFVRGFSRVSDDALDTLRQQYPSVEVAYQELKDGSEDTGGGEEETGEDDVREHVEIQWSLIQLGLMHDYDVYVAKNDQSETYQNETLGEDCIENLPLTGFSAAARSIIEYVDVIWLDGEYIVKMFEVESTTSIYSGILRMTDFIVKVPNLAVDMYIVAAEDDEALVRKQIDRPTFQHILEPAKYSSLNYLSFERVRERFDLVQQAGPLKTVFE